MVLFLAPMIASARWDDQHMDLNHPGVVKLPVKAQWQRTCQCRRPVIDPRQETPWRRKLQPTPGFLPGESHGQRSLAGYSPWGHKRVRHSFMAKQEEALYSLSMRYFPAGGRMRRVGASYPFKLLLRKEIWGR